MARKEILTLVDDLDGSTSDDISTVEFGLDGVTFEIDLTADNAARLRDALAEFVGHARRVGGRRRPGTKPTATTTSNASEVREWAEQQGIELSGRGRIPKHVIEAYEADQAAKSASSTGKSRGGRSTQARKNPPATPVFADTETATRRAGRRAAAKNGKAR